MKNEALERIIEGYNRWLSYSDDPHAKDWRQWHGKPSFELLWWAVFLLALYLLFVFPHGIYGVVRDSAIRLVWPDRVQIVEGEEVVAEFTTYAPVLTAEGFLVGKYQKGRVYSKAVLPPKTWRTYYFGKPTNSEQDRVVFARGDSYATVLVDYGDGVVYDLNLGCTAQNSPFHLSRFSEGRDFGWIGADSLAEPYFR